MVEKAKDELPRYFYCNLCDKSYVGQLRKHCTYCHKCTLGYDHHCKYLNQCISQDNYRVWFIWVCALFVMFITEFAGSLGGIIMMALDRETGTSAHDGPGKVLGFCLVGFTMGVQGYVAGEVGCLIAFHYTLHKLNNVHYRKFVSTFNIRPHKDGQYKLFDHEKEVSMVANALFHWSMQVDILSSVDIRLSRGSLEDGIELDISISEVDEGKAGEGKPEAKEAVTGGLMPSSLASSFTTQPEKLTDGLRKAKGSYEPGKISKLEERNARILMAIARMKVNHKIKPVDHSEAVRVASTLSPSSQGDGRSTWNEICANLCIPNDPMTNAETLRQELATAKALFLEMDAAEGIRMSEAGGQEAHTQDDERKMKDLAFEEFNISEREYKEIIKTYILLDTQGKCLKDRSFWITQKTDWLAEYDYQEHIKGYIDETDLKRAMEGLGLHPTEKDVRALINEADSDGSGRVSRTEFVRLMASRKVEDEDEEQLRDLFDTCRALAVPKGATTPSGIKITNFQQYVTQKSPETYHQSLSRHHKLSPPQVISMLEFFDHDGDGELNFKEFCEAIRRHRGKVTLDSMRMSVGVGVNSTDAPEDLTMRSSASAPTRV